MPIKAEDGTLTGEYLRSDEGIRRNSTIEALAALPTGAELGARDGARHHGGQVVADDRRRRGHAHRRPRRRRVARAAGAAPVSSDFAVAAEDAAIVLSAPVPVTYKLLKRSGMKVEQFDAVESNGPSPPMWRNEFGYDPDRFNPRGGAIVLGAPRLGASGVRLMGTLLNQLEATGGRFGFQTMCEGGGQANATVIERLG